MNETENNQNLNPNIFAVTKKTLFILVIFSLIFGGLGGATFSFLMTKSQNAKNSSFNSKNPGFNEARQTLVEESSIIDVVQKVSPAVVSIVASKDLGQMQGYGFDPFSDDPFFNFFGQQNSRQKQSSSPNVQEVGAGSGFFVSADGTILTNRHVVLDEQASYMVITSEGKKYEAKVLARDPINDLAIIKIDIKNAPSLSLADSLKTKIGQRVIAIGNSLGQYQNTVTSGIVSGIGRSITAGGQEGSELLEGVIQTDAAINPGNSGGPLLNIEGQVIGINTAIDQQGQLVGFAIPSNDASKALVSYAKNGKITRPFLGVRYIMITKDFAKAQKLPKDYGALVLRGQTVADFAVLPGSPADKAGIVENDIILEANGSRIEDKTTLSSVLKNLNAGDEVTLKVYHKGDEKILKIKLEDSK